jgi:hypothetical protein
MILSVIPYNLQMHMNNKKSRVMYSIGLSSIALALAFMILPNNNNAMAQQSSSTLSPNRPNYMSMSSGLQNQNWTGSISIFSPILDAFKSKIHTTLNNATTSALNAVGGGGTSSNSSVVAAFIRPERGFLVYDVFVLDSSNNIHRVIVDPGNGRVLSNQQMSLMDMMFMMHHHSMGMGMMMGGGGRPGMGMMGHGMMMGGPQGMMMRPSHSMMMGHGMGMMGGPQDSGGWS